MLLNEIVICVEVWRYLTAIRQLGVAALIYQLHGIDMRVERVL